MPYKSADLVQYRSYFHLMKLTGIIYIFMQVNKSKPGS